MVTTSNPTTLTTSTKQLGECVQQSFGRCCLSPGFFDDFYTAFTSSSPKIGPKFAKTDMTKQKTLLRQGIGYMIMFYLESSVAVDVIKGLGTSHAKNRLDIEPSMYSLWLDSLVSTVKKHDKKLTPALEKNWRTVMQKGISKMQSMYT